MKEIKLTQGKVALVDDVDFEHLNQFKWFAKKNCKTYYAVRQSKRENGKQHAIWMHREIMNPDEVLFIDHVDRNGLNNQKENLRVVSNAENAQNKGLVNNNTSGITGVSWDKLRSVWQVNLMINRINIKIGRYKDKNEAIKARFEAVKKYHPFRQSQLCQ